MKCCPVVCVDKLLTVRSTFGSSQAHSEAYETYILVVISQHKRGQRTKRRAKVEALKPKALNMEYFCRDFISLLGHPGHIDRPPLRPINYLSSDHTIQ